MQNTKNREPASIDDYKKASGDVWKFFKAHCEPKDDDAWWRDLVAASDKVCEKWKDTELKKYVLDYTVLCMGEIERIWKKGKQ